MQLTPQNTGWIEVICGSMFSGKTEELIRRLRRAMIARQQVKVFKAAVKQRPTNNSIISHSNMTIACIPIKKPEDIWQHLDDTTQVVGIDEVQFFDDSIVKVCQQLADKGIRVICAGLDQDYQARPFEPMAQLLAVAEYITKMLAICVKCGNPANRTQRLVPVKDRILVGLEGAYEARCRRCHSVA